MQLTLLVLVFLCSVSSCLGIVSRESAAAAVAQAVEPTLNSLADALRKELLDEGTDTSEADEAAARERLVKEAKRLEQEHGPGAKRAATLMRQLASQGEGEHATPAEDSKPEEKNDEGSEVHTFSESSVSESSTETDRNGHRVIRRHVKTCKNGVCEEHSDTSKPSGKLDTGVELSRGKQSQDSGEISNSEDSELDQDAMDHTASAIRREAQNVAKQFHDVMAHGPFSDDDFQFPAPAGESFWNHFRNFGSSDSASSVSRQSETVMKDGKVVTRTKRCRNGKCKTTVEQRDAEVQDEPEPTRVTDLEPTADAASEAEW